MATVYVVQSKGDGDVLGVVTANESGIRKFMNTVKNKFNKTYNTTDAYVKMANRGSLVHFTVTDGKRSETYILSAYVLNGIS